jgi:tRNA U38,U39,U40 pseudouridine synthase TruA
MEPSRLEFVLNRVLSTEMRMWNVSYAPTVNAERKEKGYAWHAITDARSKIYVYRLCTAAAVDPLRRLYYSHVYTPIDIKLFRYALSKFKGQHDFQAFANRVEKTKLEKGKGVSARRTALCIRMCACLIHWKL